MKNSIRTMFVILAVLMSFVAVQAASADTVTVEGTITAISTTPNMITVDTVDSDTDVYGVKFDYLDNRCGITLSVDMDVTVKAEEYYCALNDITVLKAVSIDDCKLPSSKR